MNSQTISNRANSSHFGHSDAHRGEASRETVAKSTTTAATPPVKAQAKEDQKQKKSSPAKEVIAGSAADAQPTTHSAEAKETTFKLEAAHANEVLLAGCFTDWKKTPVKMVKGGGGVWHAKVNLKPGNYHYRYIVDGNWQDDPHQTQRTPNPYGSSDMVLKVA